MTLIDEEVEEVTRLIETTMRWTPALKGGINNFFSPPIEDTLPIFCDEDSPLEMIVKSWEYYVTYTEMCKIQKQMEGENV